ncbi:putative transcription elongation factor TFIIS [Cafeteria roenbergensis virus]|uniref:Putative transcription elongation factor TFIIS n=1 Tax=Cafeteria roenbergensis virus (strain BV-PW1) TaxID=693272 RepID=E3T569_CROVB|nr:putative transcription elongation factor TFIIS [Cafeteria roenbergensis virus BV-PW1]ADO67332.1 putative transcription elongation factor TFIIS [Cafeteria roenbergensis virus BV-PW1]
MDRTLYQKQMLDLVKDSKLATKLENSIFKWTNDYMETNITPPFMFENFYQDKFSDIIKHLNIKNNPYLLEAIKTGKIKPENIAFLKPEEIYPEKFEAILNKRKLEKAIKDNQATTDAFKCPRCKKRKAKIDQKQIRAGDEPMTTFVTCVECGNVQKF